MRSTLLVPPLLALAASAAGAQQAPSAAERLGWLAGCWEARAGGRVVEEQWMRPRGGTLLGMSRTVSADGAAGHELMLVVERGGGLVLEARPSGQPPAEFREVEAGPGRAVFANPAHDFPQRIVYRRAGADSLVARVEGEVGGVLRGSEFRYARVACP